MKEKTLFREFLQAGGYMNYNDIYAKAETPIKEQLQSMLANLPDEEQLAALEGDIKTLTVSVDAMSWESPSMKASMDGLSKDLFLTRQHLRNVISKVEQMLRDLSLTEPTHPGEDVPNPEVEKDSIENHAPYSRPVVKENYVGKWHGKSAKYTVDELVEKFGKERIAKGVKVEHEHTKDKKMALRITLDHLCEDEDYYDKLQKMEN